VQARHEMLRESLEIIKLLWSGGYHSYKGKHLTLEDAQVFDLPETPPLIAAAPPRCSPTVRGCRLPPPGTDQRRSGSGGFLRLLCFGTCARVKKADTVLLRISEQRCHRRVAQR
jgi:hypothetical protein